MEIFIIPGTLFSLFVLSLPVTSAFLAKLLEKNYDLVTSEAQAIVVLGSGLRRSAIEYGNKPTVSNRTLERLRYAAVLNRQTGLPVLVSGGHVFNEDELSESEIMAAVLEKEFNVPVHWQETKSHNTRENALFSQGILQREHINRILLVTHAFHLPRAMIEFKHASFTVFPAPTVYFSRPYDTVSWHDIIPAPSALMISGFILHEYLGMLWYQLRYSFSSSSSPKGRGN